MLLLGRVALRRFRSFVSPYLLSRTHTQTLRERGKNKCFFVNWKEE